MRQRAGIKKYSLMGTVHLFAECNAVEFVQHGLVEALAKVLANAGKIEGSSPAA
jgi:hypothetical protein